MRSEVRRWNCRKCSRSNEIVPALGGRLKCDFCGDVRGMQQSRRRVGEILRRWTVDSLSFVGEQLRPRPGFEDELVADVRRLNLAAVAAKLTAVRSAPA
jgi:hypothetical protein